MTRRYVICYAMIFTLAWAGWRTLEARQAPPSLLPPTDPGAGLPVPAGDVPAITPRASGFATGPVRAEPAVRLEWSGPQCVRVGQTNDYTLTVRNSSDVAVQDVKVRVFVASKCVTAAEPRPSVEDGAYVWDLGGLAPKQDRQIQIRMAHGEKGNFGATARVTFSASAAIAVRASEPQLLVKASGSARCQLGDGTGFVVTVTNPGDGVAEKVKLTAEVPEGLEHVKGRYVSYDIGNLQPGETRTVQVLCVARAGGEHVCKAVAEGEGGLKSADQTTVTVVAPRLVVETRGPALRYLDRKATYTIRATNPGDAPAGNVMIADVLPAGFKFLSADSGGRYDPASRTVSWYAGEIGPGQYREVSVEVQAVNMGEFTHEATAQAARGLKSSHQLPVRVEGISAILLEVVDLEDPIEANGETTYEIRITNTGSKTETDLRLTCQVPDNLQFKSATGPTGFTQNADSIVFHPLPQLAPRADAVYRVTCRATTPGIAHFKAKITSAILVNPVHKEEATRVYADQ
jgi:uncharacterized repeat protein (TIGR01451 family)